MPPNLIRTKRYELRVRYRCHAHGTAQNRRGLIHLRNNIVGAPSFSPYLLNAGKNKVAFHISLFTFHLLPLAPHQLIRQLSEILNDQVLAQFVDIDLDTQLVFQVEHEFH